MLIFVQGSQECFTLVSAILFYYTAEAGEKGEPNGVGKVYSPHLGFTSYRAIVGKFILFAQPPPPPMNNTGLVLLLLGIIHFVVRHVRQTLCRLSTLWRINLSVEDFRWLCSLLAARRSRPTMYEGT